MSLGSWLIIAYIYYVLHVYNILMSYLIISLRELKIVEYFV